MSYEDFPQTMELLAKAHGHSYIVPLIQGELEGIRDSGCGSASLYADNTLLLSDDERQKLRETVQRATEASCADIGIRQGYAVPGQSQRAAAIAASITMASENMISQLTPEPPDYGGRVGARLAAWGASLGSGREGLDPVKFSEEAP